MDDFTQDFLSEAQDMLEELDNQLVELEQNPSPELITAIFRVMHSIKGSAGFIPFDRLVAITHAAENLMVKYRDGGEVTSDGITLILESIDAVKAILSEIPKNNGKEPDGDDGMLIDLLNDAADEIELPPDAAAEAQEVDQVETGSDDTADQEGGSEPKEPRPTPEAAAQNPEPEKTQPAAPVAEQTVKVKIELLDELMNLVGELVLSRNQILQVEKSNPGSTLTTPVQNLSNITSELQESVMKTRMQPISAVFKNYPRMVRDLAKKVTPPKKIALHVEGETTEIDRQVLAMIREPLSHMIRNCADHALETPEERAAVGKPETGRITLKAFHEGGHIIIQICDDGRGIAVENVARKALEKGLITPEQREYMSDDRICALIFEKGFSTADKETTISGRGVGMDVVKANIEKIGGTISVDSQVGRGTTFSIKIPLTLAIISSFIVSSGKTSAESPGDMVFAIPQINVIEIIDLSHRSQLYSIENIKGSTLLKLREKIYPLIDLSQVLGLDPGPNQTVLVCQVGPETFGILVNKVKKTEEIVVKPLSRALSDTKLYSGNTILGEGSVVMILDPNGLFSTFGVPPKVSEQIDDEPPSASSNEITQMVLFTTGKSGQKAVHLSFIERIDRIETSKIQKVSDGRYLVQYEDTLMPVILPRGGELDTNKGIQRLIIFTDDNRSMGFLVDTVHEISETDVRIDVASEEDGIIGSALINGAPTEIIDVSYYLDKILSSWITDGGASREEKNLRVMIIDDSRFFRNTLHSMVAARGYNVESFENPVNALKKLKSDSYDVLVSDIEMPEMSGLDLIRQVRKDNSIRSIPAIAISSHSKDEDREAGLSAGFDEYLSKEDRDSIFDFLQSIASKKAEEKNG